MDIEFCASYCTILKKEKKKRLFSSSATGDPVFLLAEPYLCK